MDKEFWAEIAKNDYKIPEGYTLEALTQTLFSYLGSTDPELRDDIAYGVYANWLKRDMFTRDEVRMHADELLSNLDKGIGETESDSVFLRTFSVLLLAEIVHNDNKKPLLEKEDVQFILAKGLWYLEAEKDPRGYVQVKGWAHALAHTADLLMVLSKNRNVAKDNLSDILKAVAKKITRQNNYVYIHREDERLANAVIQIFKRNLLSYSEIEAWINSLLSPNGFSWRGDHYQEVISRAFQNTRNLLRSVYLEILNAEEVSEKEELNSLFLDTLQTLQQS